MFSDDGESPSDVQNSGFNNLQPGFPNPGSQFDPNNVSNICPGGLMSANCNGQIFCIQAGETCPLVNFDPFYNPNQFGLQSKKLSLTTLNSKTTSSWSNPMVHRRVSSSTIKQKSSCYDLKTLTNMGRVFCERQGSYSNLNMPQIGNDFFQQNIQYDPYAPQTVNPGSGQPLNKINAGDLQATLKKFAGKSAFTVVKSYASPVQDQGQEGACTAYGMTHTVEATANMKQESTNFSSVADNFWRTYSQPYTHLMAAQVTNHTFSNGSNSVRVKNIVPINNVDDMLTTLSNNKAIFAASGTNSSWNNMAGGQGGSLSCGNEGMMGHAYSIQGFKVNSAGDGGYLIIKNSWGTNWGIDGYSKLPIGCLDKFSAPFELEAASVDLKITN